jgi:hypothetical protein
MPALITHQLIAEKVLNIINEDVKHHIKDRQMYYFGAQGGDPFYLYKYMTLHKKVNFGIALHRGEIYNTFSSFKDYIEKTEEIAAFSYVLGYITHYATDIIFHPFVYYLIDKYKNIENDKIRKRDKLHYLIEGDLDVFFLQKQKAKQPKEYVYPLRFKDIQTNKLYLLYEKAYFDLCSEDLDKKSFERAIKRFFFYNRMLNDRNYKKQKFILKIENFFNSSHILSYLFRREKPDDKNINIEKELWYNLENPDTSKNHSAEELFDKSVQLSKELILEFINNLETKTPLKTENFSTDFNIGQL